MLTWIEVEDGYVTNQPLKFISGRRERVPDPDNPPTQAFLFCYHCRRLKSGRIQRRRYLKTIEVTQTSQLVPKIDEFVSAPDVKLIEIVDNPNKFISDGLEVKAVLGS